MGNCQAVDVVSSVNVEHPGGRHEKVPASFTARHLMDRHPGFFVALVVPSSPPSSSSSSSSSLKLLPADAPLSAGNSYRLVSFEEVFKHFAEAYCSESTEQDMSRSSPSNLASLPSLSGTFVWPAKPIPHSHTVKRVNPVASYAL